MRHNDLAVLDKMSLAELEKSLDKHTREIVEPDKWMLFSWSVSRHHTFESCKRQYYLTYYGSRRVREAKNPAVSAVWWLKQVTPLRTWIGSVIHHAAKIAVEAHRAGESIDANGLQKEVTKYYRDSMRASERGGKHDDQWVVLFEHIYPEEYSIDRDQAEALIFDLTRTLLESEAFDFITSLPREAILEVDEPFQSFDFEFPTIGKKQVFAIPDVLLEHDDELYIIDWKTGDTAAPGIREQAGVYRLYAHQEYNVPEEKIHVTIADVGGNGQSLDPSGGVPSAAESRAFIQRSAAAMLDRLEDVPYNTAAIRNFPMTDNLSLCQQCGFKRACWRHKG